jgi:hypothetical protein
MKLFIAGFVIATIGFSGVANILDVGVSIVKGQAQQLNSQLEQVDN